MGAGHSIAALSMAQMARYFRQQETLALKREQENTVQQKRESANRRRTSNGSPKMIAKQKTGSTTSGQARNNGNGNGKRAGSRIADDKRCPVHPGMNHTWGQCRANAYNSNRDAKRPRFDNASKKGSTETNVAETSSKQDNNMEAAVAAVNDLDNIDMDAGTFECHFMVESSGISHHLDSLSFSATQIESSKGSFEYSDSFVSLCEESYTTGLDEITLNMPYDITSPLRLRAISIATVELVQNVPSKRPLRVLFDSGSDKTLWNRKALPKGVMPHTLKNGGSRVTGVHGTECLSHEVLFSGLSFPEFSSTRRVPGPIRATVFDNPDSNYDIIIGLDLLMLLGIDVRSSTRTIEWQSKTIAFKPANYFDRTFDGSSFEARKVDQVHP